MVLVVAPVLLALALRQAMALLCLVWVHALVVPYDLELAVRDAVHCLLGEGRRGSSVQAAALTLCL